MTLVLPTEQQIVDTAVARPRRRSRTALPRPDARSNERAGPAARFSRAERTAAFGLPLVFYLVLGSLLAFRYHVWFGDAQSRLANAYYVLYSRDPHLAAIGFVWNPGMSLAELPVLIFKPIWPALSKDVFAAVLVSAAAMAGAGYQLMRLMEDMHIWRLVRWSLLMAFVANPMIFYFGANGMSEALFIFTLMATTRYLLAWLRDPSARNLVTAAMFLGLAYVVRNEAVAVAGFGFVLVAGTTFWRTAGDRRDRVNSALTDSTLFLLPVTLAFAGWAIVSYVIVGHPFEQFSSVYGTSSQIQLGGGATGTTSIRLSWAFRALVWMVPALLPLIPLACWRAWRQRQAAVLAILSIFGAVVLFEETAYTLGKITYELRYMMYGIPLTILLAACLSAPSGHSGGQRAGLSWVMVARARTYLLEDVALCLLGIVMAAWCIVATEHAMLYTSFDQDDQQTLAGVLWPGSAVAKADPKPKNWNAVLAEARRLDALHLHHGAIMVDNADSCIPNLILESNDPKEFAIPNDEDYVEKMGAPYESGVRYFFVANPVGLSASDAMDREWPSLYDDGAGLAALVSTIDLPGCGTKFRLYKLYPNST